MTERHNRDVKEIRSRLLKSDIHGNTAIGQERLAHGWKVLRPDMVCEREGRGGRTLEILEFSCQYGYVSHEGEALATASEQKKAKYLQLLRPRDVKLGRRTPDEAITGSF
jgi:hypothetical protein